jgi:hypothetical protein
MLLVEELVMAEERGANTRAGQRVITERSGFLGIE